MKKLFLYIAILCFAFWIGFIIMRDIYGRKDYSYLVSEENEQTEITENDVYDPAMTNQISCPQSDYYLYNAVGLSSAKNISDTMDEDYVISVENGYIVVYVSENTVYEYTGIDAELLKIFDRNLYDRLADGIHFRSIDDVYKFLESISS
ncbi:MAG: hypothetical protein ACI39Q_09185 [Wujia sp.]